MSHLMNFSNSDRQVLHLVTPSLHPQFILRQIPNPQSSQITKCHWPSYGAWRQSRYRQAMHTHSGNSPESSYT